MSRSISARAADAVRPPSPDGRRGDRPIRAPQYNAAFGERQNAPRSLQRILTSVRLLDLSKLIADRAPLDADAACKFLEVVVNHCPTDEMPRPQWLRAWADQNNLSCTGRHIANACAVPTRTYSNDQIASLLSVSFVDQQRLRLWSFGACDVSRDERKRLAATRKREKDRQRAADRRRAKGAKTRAQYETGSLSRTKPWDAAGKSKRSWYRHRGTSA
jgi:hypothetical protein